MALRNPSFVRALSASASKVGKPSLTPGMPVDTSSYTSTGGSGADSTALSTDMKEASGKAVAAYRIALRDISAMRRNFTIMEDEDYVTSVIRDNFEKHRGVTDPKIIDMLVFKALQELREIREQWKSRYHVYSYIQRYTEKLLRQELALKIQSTDTSDRREHMLADWRDKGLVPSEIINWSMFNRWKSDEEDKFRNFAIDNKLFSSQQLESNSSTSSRTSTCTIM